MSCFVSLGRVESGLLVTDLGTAKELHLSPERKRNDLDTKLFAYAHSIWSRIENREKSGEIERIPNVPRVKNKETSIELFPFHINVLTA